MDPITPAGHRRRRSSLVSPAGNASGSRHRSPRPARNQSRGPNDSKISEEGSDGEFARLNSRDEVDLSDEDLHDDEETGLTGRDRRKKRLKKSRITRLDQRIARDDNIIEEEKKEADKSVVKSLALNVLLIGLWYFFSLMISLVRMFFYTEITNSRRANMRSSIINGCLVLVNTNSTFHSRSLPPQRTCSCNFPWHLVCSFSYLRYALESPSGLIWASPGTKQTWTSLS